MTLEYRHVGKESKLHPVIHVEDQHVDQVEAVADIAKESQDRMVGKKAQRTCAEQQTAGDDSSEEQIQGSEMECSAGEGVMQWFVNQEESEAARKGES